MEKTMRAAVIYKFGGIDEFSLQKIPVPVIGADEVLIRVAYAGVGQWDPFERRGGYAEMLGIESKFPYVLGSEGSGIIVSVGDNVDRFKAGDHVYAAGFLNPRGGFYAEYAAINADYVSLSPETFSAEQAAVFSGVGITALRGLSDVLNLKKGESIAILGAGGGIGHIAVQLAAGMGARVFAIASGEDGVAFVKGLGIDCVINGRDDTVASAAGSFGFDEFDAALLTSGSGINEWIISNMSAGGRVAYPFGIFPEPQPADAIKIEGYHGEPDPDILQRLNNFADNIIPHVDRIFTLEHVADAHQYLLQHYLGKLALKI